MWIFFVSVEIGGRVFLYNGCWEILMFYVGGCKEGVVEGWVGVCICWVMGGWVLVMCGEEIKVFW